MLGATQVTVTDVGAPDSHSASTIYDFPQGADQSIEHLNGVVNAGIRWKVFSSGANVSTVDDPTTAQPTSMTVYAASPGYLQAIDPTITNGALINAFEDARKLRVALLGQAAASQLGITNLTSQPAVFIDGAGYTIVGILGSDKLDPEDLLGIMIPDQTAMEDYGLPSTNNPARMLIETKLGAASLIAHQAPLALRPDQPDLLQAIAPPNPHTLQDTVNDNLNSLFLLLAALTLVIGTIGIANTTLVAVMERTAEIGLRRALGARPRHIAGQFLTETTLLGTVGGLIGTAIGVALVLAVAISHHWTAVLNPATTLPAPLIGTLTGFLAGSYPALRAARVQPLEAPRR